MSGAGGDIDADEAEEADADDEPVDVDEADEAADDEDVKWPLGSCCWNAFEALIDKIVINKHNKRLTFLIFVMILNLL